MTLTQYRLVQIFRVRFDELVISGTTGEYNQTRDTRVVDRSNTGQEVKAIRGTDSILLVQIF